MERAASERVVFEESVATNWPEAVAFITSTWNYRGTVIEHIDGHDLVKFTILKSLESCVERVFRATTKPRIRNPKG